MFRSKDFFNERSAGISSVLLFDRIEEHMISGKDCELKRIEVELEKPGTERRFIKVIAFTNHLRQEVYFRIFKSEIAVRIADEFCFSLFVGEEYFCGTLGDDGRGDGAAGGIIGFLRCKNDEDVFFSKRFKPFDYFSGKHRIL